MNTTVTGTRNYVHENTHATLFHSVDQQQVSVPQAFVFDSELAFQTVPFRATSK